MKNLMFVLGIMMGLPVLAGVEADRNAIDNCLSHWGKNPFGKTPGYRTIGGHVRVLGGGGQVNDDFTTQKPELVLVKPNVTVLSKSTLRLMNPNGWYCLKGRVAVLGKTQIDVNCKAKLTSSEGGAKVLAGGEDNGTTVLGSSRVNRIGCTTN